MSEEKIPESVEKVLKELEKHPIESWEDRKIFHPDGYAKRIAEDEKVKLTPVQLRRIYSEVKYLADRVEKDAISGKLSESINRYIYRFYKLYVIINYQANRKVLDKHFAKVLIKLLNQIEKAKEYEDNLETFTKRFSKTRDFLMAIVAYSKEKGG